MSNSCNPISIYIQYYNSTWLGKNTVHNLYLKHLTWYQSTLKTNVFSQPIYQTPYLQMSSSSILATPSTTTSSHSLSPIQHLITIKLNRDNYLLWKAQIIPYLKGLHLFGFIDGTHQTYTGSNWTLLTIVRSLNCNLTSLFEV